MCTLKIWLGKKINGLGGLKRYLEDTHHTFTPTTNCDKLSDSDLGSISYEGGGTLHQNAEPDLNRAAGGGELDGTPVQQTRSQWYALYTRSHCEQLVYEQLAARGFSVFLPKLDVWSRRGGVRHRIAMPMFPSYLFVHHIMDKLGFIDVAKARGLVRILGGRWDRLSPVPETEINAIQRVLQAE